MAETKHYRDEKAIKAFGKKVRELRKAKGMSIEQLANSIDLQVTQLSRIERGETNVTISSITRLAKVFGLKPGEML